MTNLPVLPSCSWCDPNALSISLPPCARCAVALDRLAQPGVSRVSKNGVILE
jgi:hypothetical protein